MPAPSEAWVWRSSGGDGFEIAPASAEQAERVPRGTEIVLHLKPDAKRYLETYEIERVVKTYSDHILFPIELKTAEGRAAPDQRRERALAAPEVGAQARGLYAGLSLHRRRLRRAGDDDPLQGRGAAVLRRAAVRAVEPSRSICSIPTRKGRIKLYVRRVYITDDAEPAASLPALHARRGRQRGPAAQHFARDAAEQSAGGADQQGAHRPRPHRAGKPGRQGRRGVRQDLGRLRQGRERRHVRRLRAARPASGIVPVQYHRRRRRVRSSNTSRTSSRTRPRSTISSARAPSASNRTPSSRRRAPAASRSCCSPIRWTRSGRRRRSASRASRLSR